MTTAAPRILFVGAVEEGRRCLDALVASGERFCGIVTLKESLAAATSGAVPFDDVAAAQRIPILKVGDLNAQANVARVEALAPDLILVIGWTRLLGPRILRLPPLGCVGFHASLLPRYRGRAPVNWALINGEAATGNTMFFLDEGVDTGDIIAQRRIAIALEDTCATLYRKVSDAATGMLAEYLPLLKTGRARRWPQDHSMATVMPRRRPEDGVIDWGRSSGELHNWVRALTHPYPGAFTWFGGTRLFVWEARDAGGEAMGPPGLVMTREGSDLLVAAAAGRLAIRSAQWEGRTEGPAAAMTELIGRRLDGARGEG
ncbi:MAG TPA: methionyl-tRNA formyltransferase [Candidatus Polarisedimenticolia bacterium]|jgi:methionyl-tRNA formyltransferase